MPIKPKTYYSNGKVLLSGEYVVLDGATALALPTTYGQSLQVIETSSQALQWKSIDCKGKVWFEAIFNTQTLTPIHASDIATTLSEILITARNLNPNFLTTTTGVEVTTSLDFPRNWGLGTSSTLINNIAQWAQVDAYSLLFKSFGGSGYDIAAAQSNKPLLYTNSSQPPSTTQVHLNWDFKDQLYFIHLNQKQDSKKGIKAYNTKKKDPKLIHYITDLSKKLLLCYTITDFENIIQAHEVKISALLERPTVKELLFPEYPRAIKSLGAWGGDFILAAGTENEMDFFKQKGYTTIIPFNKMIK